MWMWVMWYFKLQGVLHDFSFVKMFLIWHFIFWFYWKSYNISCYCKQYLFVDFSPLSRSTFYQMKKVPIHYIFLYIYKRLFYKTFLWPMLLNTNIKMNVNELFGCTWTLSFSSSRTCQQTFWLMLSFSNLWVFVHVLITHLKTKESSFFF